MLREVLRVVLHIDKENRWDILYQNVKDIFHEEEFTPFKFNIEVVITGTAIKKLDNTLPSAKEFEKKLNDITDRGVIVIASNNDIIYYKVDSDTLFSSIKVVPDGITELIIKQEEGYRYVKI